MCIYLFAIINIHKVNIYTISKAQYIYIILYTHQGAALIGMTSGNTRKPSIEAGIRRNAICYNT